MNCSWIRDKLSSYVDEQLCPLDVKKIEKHLKQCKTCRCELEKLHGVSKLVYSLEEVSPPEDFSDRIIAEASGLKKRDSDKHSNALMSRMLSLKNASALIVGVLLLGNGLIFAFYGGEELAVSEQEQTINLSEEERAEFYKSMAEVLDRDYYNMLPGEADVRKASSEGEIDISKYEENGVTKSGIDTRPFKVFNGVFLTIAASAFITLKIRERGD